MVAGWPDTQTNTINNTLFISDAIWFVDKPFKLGNDGGSLLVGRRSVSELAGFTKAT